MCPPIPPSFLHIKFLEYLKYDNIFVPYVYDQNFSLCGMESLSLLEGFEHRNALIFAQLKPQRRDPL